jgi:two-component system NtrC family sensor kinase
MVSLCSPLPTFNLLVFFIADIAVEAMPEGGRLTVVTRRSDNSHVAVDVQDTGTGISEENLGRLFTPFFTTKPIGKGTGLGLAIVYGIVKMHRGQIEVKSQLGVGTTFTVTLPVELAPAQLPQRASNMVSWPGPRCPLSN